MWPGLIQSAKEGGVDVIETYVFWNGHEPSPDNVSKSNSQESYGYLVTWKISVLIPFIYQIFSCSIILGDDTIWSSS